MSPDEQKRLVSELARIVRSGDLDAYLEPGVLARLRYEAATGKGRSRTLEEWNALQIGLQNYRNAEDGARVRPEPFAPRHEHDPEDAYAAPGSDRQVLFNYTKRMSQSIEDDQLGEMLVGQMGSDANRKPDRVSLRDQLEAAWDVHTPGQGG